jgi:hypothetical protein
MRLASVLMVLALASPALAGEPAAPPLADLLAEAQRASKPLLLDFSTVW